LRLGSFWGLGRFEAWDVLYFGCFRVGTFWGLGHFEAWTFCSLDIMSLDVLYLGRFVFGTFCIWDVLQLGRYVFGRFVCAPAWHYIQTCIVYSPSSCSPSWPPNRLAGPEPTCREQLILSGVFVNCALFGSGYSVLISSSHAHPSFGAPWGGGWAAYWA
jgi:hypothetical protein